MNTLLKITDVSTGYYREEIIKSLSLEIKEGDFLGLIGPNGSGKTTLLRAATRVLNLYQGNIYFKGKDIFQINLKEFCRNIAFVAQDIGVNFTFSVWEMVLMGRIPYLNRLQFESQKDINAAENALIKTDTLNLKQKFMDELSAGERQRVIIARALAQEPVLLFLDEPTAHLDIGHQIQVMDMLKKLNQENKLTIVMVLHDLNLASAYCNRLALLDSGRIYKEGSPEEVLTYQNIEAVYNTLVLVNENPLTKKPNVILVPGSK